jgi:hypothetical protein
MAEVLPRGGFVQNDQFRLLHQHAGNGYTLFLAKAQCGNGPVAEGVQPANLQSIFHPLADLFLGHIAALQGQRNFLKDHGFGDHLVGVLHHIANVLGAAADVLLSHDLR